MKDYSQSWKRLLFRFNAEIQPKESCFWGVDIHSHLLPGIDDGVKNTQQTLACLTRLVDWNIQKIIVTPHINEYQYPTSVEAIQEGQRVIQNLIDDHQLPIKLEVAAEYLVDSLFFSLLKQGTLLTFGAKRYLLIETGWVSTPHQFNEILVRIQAQGYTPVLAHPERYKYYHNHKNNLLQLREWGCLLQLNWMSLVGRYGLEVQKQARFLLQNKAVDFIGSDLHKPHDLEIMQRIFNDVDLDLLRSQPLLNESLLQNVSDVGKIG